MHHNASLKDRYLHFCSLCDVEPNSGVVGAFQSKSSNHQGDPSTPELPQHLSLSGNMSGPRGFLPIVMTLAECPTIRHLDLRDNNLNHESVKELCATLLVPKPWPDPAIHSVDLRGNNNILLSGPDLVSCIKKNPRLLHIEIDSSQLRPLFRRLVQIALQKNVQQANPDDAQYCPFAIEQEAPTESNTGEKEERDLFVAYLRNEAQYATREERQVISDAWKDFQFGTKESEVIDLHGSLMSFGSFRLFEGNEYADVECDSLPNAHTTERCTAGHIGKQTTVRRRNTICDESISCEELDKDTVDGCPNSMASPLPKHNKSVEHYNQLISILEKENLFSHLDEQDLKTAVDILHEERYSAGDVLYHRDDDTAHASMPKDSPSFYIVVNGIIEITEADCSNVTTVGPGNCFGAIRLLHATPRLDVAKCLSASATVFSLHRREYKQLMARISHQRRRLFENFLSELSFLKGMKRSELLNMADALRTHTFQPGEYIIRFGERGRMFFLICEGVVEVLGRGTDMQPKWICDFTRGNCVGELEFLNDHPCVADVRAKTTVKVAMMTRHHFELVMGPAKDILASNAQDLSVYAYYREYQDGSRS